MFAFLWTNASRVCHRQAASYCNLDPTMILSSDTIFVFISLFRNCIFFSLFDRVRITLCFKMFKVGSTSIDKMKNGEFFTTKNQNRMLKWFSIYSLFYLSIFAPLCYCWRIFFIIIFLFEFWMNNGRQYHRVFTMQIVLQFMSSGNKAKYEYRK